MRQSLQEKLNIKKAARFAVVINALQVAAMVSVLLYSLMSGSVRERYVEVVAIAAATLIVSWGAVVDIREALNASKIADQAQMLEEAYRQLESLNGTLRKQRHDFMNHLQVVYSLLELEDPAEAMKYIVNVYGDIKKAGSALKTAIPAVNALIAAKRQDCEDQDIALELNITSNWSDLPMPGWEMCRVLGNLIDNARDALLSDEGLSDRRITLSIHESPSGYAFEVANNGPRIPESLYASIFQMGFTTKSGGHGNGLSIVRELLSQYGGEIHVKSDEDRTRFFGSLPRSSGAKDGR